MNSAIFEEIFSSWKNGFDSGDGYEFFAKKFGFSSAEATRSSFRRERRKRGLKRENIILENKNVVKKSPRILVFDIENSYLEIALWKLGEQYVNKTQILNDWFCLSYSAKWLYDEKVFSGVLTSKEAIKKDDKRIVGELWELLSQCDYAITYNGNLYDVPKINTRFILNGFPPPSPYKSIDVYQAISRNFAFTSRSMDFVNYKLELERKMENEGMELWKKSVAGDEEALAKMAEYNKQDSVAVEETYLLIRPWIKNHPNFGVWHDSQERVCGFCGSSNIEWITNLYPTPSGLYKTFRCKECNGLGRSKENQLSKEKRKVISPNI